MKRKIKILIADDHPAVCEGMRLMFDKQKGMKVVGLAGNGNEAVQLAKQLRPDVIFMDIKMGGGGGLQATRQITAQNSKVKIVALSAFSDKDQVGNMFEAGASGYVSKEGDYQELFDAVKMVMADQYYFSPKINDVIIKEFILTDKEKAMSRDANLTEKQREVVRLTSEGLCSKEIADRLSVTPKTVDKYRVQVMKKLNLQTMADLIKYAIRKGLTST